MTHTCVRCFCAGSVVIAGLAGFVGRAASADLGAPEPQQTAAPVADRSPWSFRFTTYGWVAWLNGDTTVAGRKLDVDVDPIELVEHLDTSSGIPAWMSYMEARNGPISLFNDVVYAKISDSGDFAKSAGRRRRTISLDGDVETDFEQATIEAGGAYEVAKWSSVPGTANYTALDVLAGARYWHQEIDASVDLTSTLNIAGLRISRGRANASSGSVDWVDPFVGARLRHQLSPGEEIVLRGDVGGFGAGSEFSWQLIGTYGWQLCTMSGFVIDGYVGYRALSVDYEQGSGLKEYEFDVLQHGPVVGMTTRF